MEQKTQGFVLTAADVSQIMTTKEVNGVVMWHFVGQKKKRRPWKVMARRLYGKISRALQRRPHMDEYSIRQYMHYRVLQMCSLCFLLYQILQN